MKLRNYQRDCIDAAREYLDTCIEDGRPPNALVVLPTGGGKALRIDQRVLTPTGWVPIGSLRVGDLVIGSNGRPIRVEGVFPQGVRPMVEVKTSDGAAIVCDDDHLWTVRTKHDRIDGYPWRTWKTRDLVAAGIKDKQGGRRWELPSVAPVDHPAMGLPIDPYLLGVILGDGGLSTIGRVIITTEHDLAETLHPYIPAPAKLKLVSHAGKAGNYIVGGPVGRSPNPVIDAIRDLGLEGHTAHSKFVPDCYMFSPAFVRLALLQGLMDTDGHVSRGNKCEITLVSHRLAEGVQALVRSLGGRATLREKPTTWTHKGERRHGVAWRVLVGLDVCPFRWKASRWTPRVKYDCSRRIESVSPAGEGEAVCIKVAAEDGLFVTEGYVLTHNTIIFSTIGKELRTEGYRRGLVLVHRNELVKQSVDKWMRVDPTESIGIYQAGRRDTHCDIIVASVASCYPDVYRDEACACTVGPAILGDDGWPSGRTEKIDARDDCPACNGEGSSRVFVRPGRIHELPLGEIDFILIDEVHHATRDSLYAKVVEAVRSKNPDCLVFGFTATPYRTDGQGLGHLFEAACFSRGIKWMVEHDFLAPPRGQRVVLNIDLSQVAVSKTSGDFKEKDLGEVMDQEDARSQIVRAWFEHAGPGTYPGDPRGRPTAMFCPTVDAAEHLAEEFVKAGVEAHWICSDKKRCSDEKRQQVLADFDAGKFPMLVNVGILTEGWDAKRTACIGVARPTKSMGLYVQIVGRGLRWMGEHSTKEESIAAGKADCLVLDFADASSLGLISLADLSDDVPEPGKKKRKKADDQPIPDDLFPDEVETRRIVGYSTFEVDLFGGGVDWCRVNGSRVAALDAGKTMVIFPTGPGVFSVMLTGKNLELLGKGLDEKQALTLAETFALENGQRRFLKPGDWFQRKPATEKQRNLVGRLANIPENRGRLDMPDPLKMSMQQASAWAGYLLARKQYVEVVVRASNADLAG